MASLYFPKISSKDQNISYDRNVFLKSQKYLSILTYCLFCIVYNCFVLNFKNVLFITHIYVNNPHIVYMHPVDKDT